MPTHMIIFFPNGEARQPSLWGTECCGLSILRRVNLGCLGRLVVLWSDVRTASGSMPDSCDFNLVTLYPENDSIVAFHEFSNRLISEFGNDPTGFFKLLDLFAAINNTE